MNAFHPNSFQFSEPLTFNVPLKALAKYFQTFKVTVYQQEDIGAWLKNSSRLRLANTLIGRDDSGAATTQRGILFENVVLFNSLISFRWITTSNTFYCNFFVVRALRYRTLKV